MKRQASHMYPIKGLTLGTVTIDPHVITLESILEKSSAQYDN